MTDYFDYSPLVLARMVERDARKRAKRKGAPQPVDGEQIFLEKLRAQLYAQYKPPRSRRTTLHAIADLIKRSKGNIRGVVSFNFDGLLEEELESARFLRSRLLTAHANTPVLSASSTRMDLYRGKAQSSVLVSFSLKTTITS